MGLDCVVKYFNNEDYTSQLPQEISNKFESVKLYGVVGFDISVYKNYYYISFRGKAYNYIVKKITDISLYNDLNIIELNEMYLKLEEFIEKFNDIDEVQKAYNDTWNLDHWLSILSDNYIPSPNELKGLKEIFKICYENKLQLYADY